MTPSEFLEQLLVHFGKRHASDEAEAFWMRDMMAAIRGSDYDVLTRAYQLIIDEHDERSFPLPAVLKRYIARAADMVHPDSARGSGDTSRYRYPTLRAPDTPEWIALCKQASAWQHAVIRDYGSWANHWRSTRHLRVKDQHAAQPRLDLPASIRLALPHAKLTVRRLPHKHIDISRPAMERLQRMSRNRHLHADHSAIARRITGERE